MILVLSLVSLDAVSSNTEESASRLVKTLVKKKFNRSIICSTNPVVSRPVSHLSLFSCIINVSSRQWSRILGFRTFGSFTQCKREDSGLDSDTLSSKEEIVDS